MKKLGIALAMTIAAVGAARAADLPTKKEVPAPAPVNCYSSYWTWLNSTPADCPLSYGPLTFYATLDIGLQYESNGAAWSPTQPNGTGSFVNKQAYGSKWLFSPNNLSQSVVGIKLSQPLWFLSGPFLSGWSLVGTVETGFQPLSWNLANGARSLAQNNGKAQLLQGFNADSGRDGQWDNSQGFVGLSNPAYGTLVWGRVNTLGLDGLVAYDVMSSAYAFSPFGFSGSYAGFGNTELTRSNTAFKYNWNSQNLLSWMNFRVAGIAQTGSYGMGNPSTEFFQGQIGADFPHLFAGNSFAGTLSADFIGGYAQNAVNLSNFTGTCTVIKSGALTGQTACTSGIPAFYNGGDLKATLSNNVGTFLLGKYKFDQFPLTISGGWNHWKQSDPSGRFPNGFQSIAGYDVPGTIVGNKLFPTTWINYTMYADPRVVNVFFIGAKYAVTPQIDVAGAFYYLEQNNYNSSTTPCAYANATFTPPNGHTFVVSRLNSGACAGSQDAYSFLIDYRPVKRVDLYAGVMVSNVYGGLANGFPVTQEIAPTAGLRIKF
jgi:predicted porin